MSSSISSASSTMQLLDNIVDDKTRVAKYNASAAEKTMMLDIQSKLLGPALAGAGANLDILA